MSSELYQSIFGEGGFLSRNDSGSGLNASSSPYLSFLDRSKQDGPGMLERDPETTWRRSGMVEINDVTGERRFVGSLDAPTSGLPGINVNMYGDLSLGGKKRTVFTQPGLVGLSDQDITNMTSYANGQIDFNNGALEMVASAVSNTAFGRLATGWMANGVTTVGSTAMNAGAMALDLTAEAADAVGASGIADYLNQGRDALRDVTWRYDQAMGHLEKQSSGDIYEDVATSVVNGDYAALGEMALDFVGDTAQDMAGAYLAGGAALATRLGAAAPTWLASRNAIALGFQAQTTVDMYNGLADRDVNRIAALSSSVIGGRLVAGLEQIGLERLFGSGAGLSVGKALGREFMPNASIAASATTAQLFKGWPQRWPR